MMPTTKELPADLTRIALFGVALELSRFVAKEVLSIVCHRYNNYYVGKNGEQNSVEPLQHLHNDNNNALCYPLSLVGNVIHRTRMMLRKLMSRRCFTLIGLTGPPPLLLYGMWNYQLNRSGGNNIINRRGGVTPLVLFCGIYASSILTSFCLMLWVYPSLLSIRCYSSNNNYDDLGEENDIILHHNSADEHDKPQLDTAKQS